MKSQKSTAVAQSPADGLIRRIRMANSTDETEEMRQYIEGLKQSKRDLTTKMWQVDGLIWQAEQELRAMIHPEMEESANVRPS